MALLLLFLGALGFGAVCMFLLGLLLSPDPDARGILNASSWLFKIQAAGLLVGSVTFSAFAAMAAGAVLSFTAGVFAKDLSKQIRP